MPLNSGGGFQPGLTYEQQSGDASDDETNTPQAEYDAWDKLSDSDLLFEEILQKYRGVFEQLAKL